MKQLNKNEIMENSLKTKGTKPKITQTTDLYTLYNVINNITTERTIFYALAPEQAEQIFLNTINANHTLKPDAFTLVKCGTWNNKTGDMVSFKKDIFVMDGYFVKQIGDDLQKLIDSIVEKKMVALFEKNKGGK